MRYALVGLAAAVAAFLLAPLVLREPPASRPAAARGGSLEQRFPEQLALFRRPSVEDARWLEKRGHAFSLEERDETDPDEDPRWRRILAGRPKRRPLSAACLECHATGGAGAVAGYYEAAKRKPLGCADCHDPQTAELRLTRGGTAAAREWAGRLRSLTVAARPREEVTPHYEELRTALCAQCHRQYLIGPAGQITFPEGRTAEEIERWYERTAHAGWTHAETGARVLEARHPQFELSSLGIHARAGASCADCHMPLLRRGAVRITDHRARSPLDMLDRACLRCHRATVEEMRARVKTVQDRTAALLSRAQDALVAAIDRIQTAQAAGARCDEALRLQTKAQWRIEFVAADRSRGFHAPQEAARLLGEAIDYARQAELEALRAVIRP
ncbi:MAG: ammonia-forming cytochrome c nitrite reductase subunit c552 [Bryobacteraceae bacterium]